MEQWPPPEFEAFFEVFDRHYRQSAQRLILAKPAFREPLKMAMRDLLEAAEKEAATGHGDVTQHRDKSMELSLKWRKNSKKPNWIQWVLVDHASLAKNELAVKDAWEYENKELKNRIAAFKYHRVRKQVAVLVAKIQKKLGVHAIPEDLRAMRLAMDALMREDVVKTQVERFEIDMDREGPYVAYKWITGHELETSVFLRGTSVFVEPVTLGEEQTCEAVLNSENPEGIPERTVAFLRDVLARVPGGKKARHLVKVTDTILQRGEDRDQCNHLLVAVGVLLLCVKRRFQAGPDCEGDYVQIHEFFSRLPADTNAARINQQLCAKFFDPATQFRTRTDPDARAPPTVPDSWVRMPGKGGGKGLTSVSPLTGGYSRGLPVVDQTCAVTSAAAGDAACGSEEAKPPGLEMKYTDPL
mmetsp:Transcript_96199/g.257157  ORF Transcript_96199/g.257157 Transcript_96199/m.257157 type:complete len:413 (+) Transcript_96199:17-1255(+)